MTWQEIEKKYPVLAKAIDGRLAELKQRIVDDRSRWLIYGRAKVEVAKRVGWHAPIGTAEELTTPDSFSAAMDHVLNVLEI